MLTLDLLSRKHYRIEIVDVNDSILVCISCLEKVHN